MSKQESTQNTEQANETPEIYLTEDGEVKYAELEEENTQPEEEEEAPQEQKEGEAQEESSEEKSSEEKEEESSEKKEESESDEITQPEGEEYTLEEVRELGIEKLDPNKIPQELVPYYKSMQADYTRKTQKLAEERKSLEKEKEEIQEQIKLADMAAQQGIPLQTLNDIRKQAATYVKQQMGDNFDEYDPDVQGIVNQVTTEMTDNYKKKVQAETRVSKVREYLQKNDPEYSKIIEHGKHMLHNEIPYAEAMKIINAGKTGDVETELAFYEKAKKDYQEKFKKETQPKTTPQEQQTTPEEDIKEVNKQRKVKQQPPVAEKPGKGVEQTSSKYTATDFSDKTTEDQARMLVEMGLV